MDDGCPAAQGLVTARETRVTDANIALGLCKNRAPEEPGTCGRTIRALNACLRTRQITSNRAWANFKARARARCGRRAVAAADRERRSCLRQPDCGCGEPMPAMLIATSADSTTTTSTTTSSTAAGATTTSSSITTTTRPPDFPTGSGCQKDCIAQVAGNCYERCQQSCSGIREAEEKCQRACRNRQCTDLRAVCAPNENTDFESSDPGRLDRGYFVCCKGPRGGGECEFDEPDGVACAPTTTTTTTTSTTSTSSTTTTTTLVTTTTTLIDR